MRLLITSFFFFTINYADCQYYVVSSSENLLYKLDISEKEPFLSLGEINDSEDSQINGFNGLTQNPIDGKVYVVYHSMQSGPRFLATLDIENYELSTIGPLIDKIANISFDNEGVLYGISGDGGPTPNRLYEIDYESADMTTLTDLSSYPDDDGEAICYNSTDGYMYRMAGGAFLYKIDLNTFEQFLVTDMLSDDGTCGHALSHNSELDQFITLATYQCTMTSSGVQDCFEAFEIPPCVKGVLPINEISSSLQTLPNLNDKRCIKVLDALGREVNQATNQILFHIYDDGSVKKKFIVD